MSERLKRALSGSAPKQPSQPTAPTEPGRLDWITRSTPGCAAGNVFDPATNTVVPADPAWLRSIGTLLPDGRLLVTDQAGNGPLVVDTAVNAREMSW